MQMNHAELQLKVYCIDKYNEATDQHGTENWQDVDKALQALIAVIELHKSYLSIYGLACLECSNIQEHPYPCPTIRAIEKELQCR